MDSIFQKPPHWRVGGIKGKLFGPSLDVRGECHRTESSDFEAIAFCTLEGSCLLLSRSIATRDLSLLRLKHSPPSAAISHSLRPYNRHPPTTNRSSYPLAPTCPHPHLHAYHQHTGTCTNQAKQFVHVQIEIMWAVLMI